MMDTKFFRVAQGKYRFDLSGKGAEMVGGRYNVVGTPAVYAGSSISLATMEVLVHQASNMYPNSHFVMAITVPSAIYNDLLVFSAVDMPDGWSSLSDQRVAQQFGHEQLFAPNKLGMLVPSVVVPEELNLVLNPKHPAMNKITIVEVRPLNLDKRLIK